MDGRRRGAVIAGGAVVVVVLGLVAVFLWSVLQPQPAPVTSPSPSASPTQTPSSAPTPSPTPTGHPANTEDYDLAALPALDVFAVIPELPVDDEPFGPTESLSARPLGDGAPVFADPAGEPIAALARELPFEGTVVPVVEREEHWVRVLLVGRQSTPSQGDAGQVTGWLRMADVELTANTTRVEVDLGDRTIDVVTPDGAERVATDFASGTTGTPTPLGRSFIMLTRAVPELAYTAGLPIVYLSAQSPTLDGFDGQSVAVTAFHYHDVRSGPISNGCIRLDGDAIARLAELPAGTPVYIRE